MSRFKASVGFSPTRWKGARKMPNLIPRWVGGMVEGSYHSSPAPVAACERAGYAAPDASREARDDRYVGEGAREAGRQGTVPQGHRGGCARLRAGRAGLLPLQRLAGSAGREHLLLLRSLR